MTLRIDRDPVTDADAVGWVRDRLVFGRDVGSWIPHGFPRYARILHPAHEWESSPGHVVRWSEIAAWSGKALTSLSFIDDVATREDGTRWSVVNRSLPMEGELVQPHLDRLTRYLAAATSTPDAIWLLVWSGYGVGTLLVRTRPPRRVLGALRRRFARRQRLPSDQGTRSAIEISPSLTGSGRTYIPHRGAIDDSAGAEQHDPHATPPSFWWPEDHAWFVSTDIDVPSTYVGGPASLVDALLADELLEVFPADLADRLGGGRYEA